MVSGCSVPVHTSTQGYRRREVDQDGKDHAEYVRVECRARLLRMAVLLLSVHPLLDQSLLHLHAARMKVLALCPSS